jgi:SAM-dependent methyltransferase
MTSSDYWNAETAEQYDETSAFMFAHEVLAPAVDALSDLAGAGPALELAIGTGRVAIPLAERGVHVSGIELSQPRADVLLLKRPELRVTVGDMATATAPDGGPGPGEFTLVYLVWNSIGNLRTQAEQVACFRNAARHLAPGGRFVIELGVPGIRRFPPGQSAVPLPRRREPRRVRHLRHGDPAGHLPPLHAPTRRHRALWRQQLPLHLAGRVRPHGPTRGARARESRRRLAREPLHRRQREPQLGLADADAGLTVRRCQRMNLVRPDDLVDQGSTGANARKR